MSWGEAAHFHAQLIAPNSITRNGDHPYVAEDLAVKFDHVGRGEGAERDQPLAFQNADGLPDGRNADVELFGNGSEIDAFTEFIVHIHDPVFHQVIDLVPQGLTGDSMCARHRAVPFFLSVLLRAKGAARPEGRGVELEGVGIAAEVQTCFLTETLNAVLNGICVGEELFGNQFQRAVGFNVCIDKSAVVRDVLGRAGAENAAEDRLLIVLGHLAETELKDAVGVEQGVCPFPVVSRLHDLGHLIRLVEPDATALGAADGKQVVGDVPGQIAADAVDLGGQRSLIGRVENEDEIVQKVKETGLDMVGIIHEDDEVTQFDIEGRPLVELPSESNTVKAVNGILSRILK